VKSSIKTFILDLTNIADEENAKNLLARSSSLNFAARHSAGTLAHRDICAIQRTTPSFYSSEACGQSKPIASNTAFTPLHSLR